MHQPPIVKCFDCGRVREARISIVTGGIIIASFCEECHEKRWADFDKAVKAGEPEAVAIAEAIKRYDQEKEQ